MRAKKKAWETWAGGAGRFIKKRIYNKNKVALVWFFCLVCF